MRRVNVLLAVGLAAVLATGCRSGSSHGPSAPTTPVDVSKLDVAGYHTDLASIGRQDLERAKLSEAQRLASVLPLAMDIDLRFKYQYGTDPESVYGFTADGAASGLHTQDLDAEAPGFISGFSVNGKTDQNISLATYFNYSVLIFTDNSAASAGARALAAMQFNRSTTNRPVSIDGHPDTQAFWSPTDDTIESFTTTEQFVIYASAANDALQAVDSSDLAELTALDKKVVEAVPPALTNFKLTPVNQLTDMPSDPTGMIGRTVFKTSHDLGRTPPGVFNQHGALLLSDNPATDRDLYTKTGMDLMAINAGRLYQTRNPAAAGELFDVRSTLSSRMYKNADPPKNLPEARCDEYRGDSSNHPRFHCTVAYGRYVAEMWSNQLLDAHQRISAQYVLMTR